MITVDDIREHLARHSPVRHGDADTRRAAVAMVLLAPDSATLPELLFIERARHEADPWSGHMAFPGGRIDPGDTSDRRAAERETLEEVGVGLEDASYLGHLGDLEGRHAGRPAGLVISAHAYHLRKAGPLRPNYEVAEAFWFPLAELPAIERRVDYAPYGGSTGIMPGVCVGDPDRHIVWGLTYRFLEIFFEMLGRPIGETRPASSDRSPQSESNPIRRRRG